MSDGMSDNFDGTKINAFERVSKSQEQKQGTCDLREIGHFSLHPHLRWTCVNWRESAQPSPDPQSECPDNCHCRGAAAQPSPERCAVCGWRLAETREKGCRPGDCSLRPLPQNAYDPIRANREYREFWGNTIHLNPWDETGAVAQPEAGEPRPKPLVFEDTCIAARGSQIQHSRRGSQK